MATSKPPYDPVRALEGMFNGSITRLGYLLKDPVGYGRDTKVVLAECAKKFHDALDDCEIQLLDAKWYLEHQLTQNRLRREAKAREAGSALKRKHEQTKETTESETKDETPSKRAKIEDSQDQAKPQTPQQTNKEKLEVGKKDENRPLSVQKSPNVKKEELKSTESSQVEKPAEPAKQEQRPLQPQQPPPQQAAAAAAPQPQTQQQNQDDFSKPTPPQDTPIDTTDEFNFTSMFGDPTADQYQDNKETNEFDFSLGLDNSFISGDGADAFGDLTGDNNDDTNNNNNTNTNNDPSSLDSILPGLETYANQTGDDNNNNNKTTDIAAAAPTTTAAAAAVAAVDGTIPDFTNDFDLPDITAPNDFDDFLNDDTLGGGGNYDGNFDLSDAALDNMDFDDDLFG